MVDSDNILRRTRAENAAHVVEKVRALGGKLHPSSRLMRMHRHLNRGYVPPDDKEFLTVLEAERDMTQLGFIFDQLDPNAILGRDKFAKLIADLVSDPVLPQDNLEHSPGRDAQFELHIGAICHRAGLLPVSFADPDITCVKSGKSFIVEAKRIKSEDQVGHRIKKAAEQIKASGLPGVIALELSLAWNRRNQPTISRIQSQMHVMIVYARGHRFFKEHADHIRKWVSRTSVIAVVVFNHKVLLRPDNHWGLDGMTTWLAIDEAQYEEFAPAFMKGIPNMTDLDA